MKTFRLNLFVIFFLLLIIPKTTNERFEVTPYTYVLGKGYSSDNKTLSPEECYSAISVEKSLSTYTVPYKSPIKLFNFVKLLRLDIPKYLEDLTFSTSKFFHFLNKINEEDFSQTIIYLSGLTNEIHIKYINSSILSPKGKEIYDNNRSLFRLLCGDYPITGINLGNFIIYAIKITSDTRSNAESFKNHFKPKGFDTILEDINYTLKKYDITMKRGFIDFFAFEINGDKDWWFPGKKGLRCSMTNLFLCKDDFQELGIILKSYKPSAHKSIFLFYIETELQISETGLIISESFITEETKKARNDLLRVFMYFNKFYRQFDYLIKVRKVNSSELTSILNELLAKLNLYYLDDTIIKCFRNVKEIGTCSNSILKDVEKLYNDLINFQKRFDWVSIINIKVENNFCLPSHLKWEKEEIISFAFYLDNEGNKSPFCFTNKSRLICDKICKEQDKYIFTIKDDLVELDFTIKIDDDEKGKLLCANKLFSMTNIMDIELNKSPNPLSQNFFDM